MNVTDTQKHDFGVEGEEGFIHLLHVIVLEEGRFSLRSLRSFCSH